MAKKVIGGEISREAPSVIDLTKSLHVLDLRRSQAKTDERDDPKPAAAPTAPAPPTLPLDQPALEAPSVHDQPAEHRRVGRAEGESGEQAGAGDESHREAESGSVRRLEPDSPAAPNKPAKQKFLKGPWPHRRIAGAAIKAVLVLAAAVIFLSLNIDLPERLIGIYFVASVVYAIDSQRTFLVALIFLVMVAIWSALGQNVPAENYAIYAFYFLVIGLISALRELFVHKPNPQGKIPE